MGGGGGQIKVSFLFIPGFYSDPVQGYMDSECALGPDHASALNMSKIVSSEAAGPGLHR